MALTSGTKLGPYEIVAPLGAEVYRARDTKLGRDVALKLLPPLFTADADRVARFEREARLLASLNHPHIGAIYGFEDGGTVPAPPDALVGLCLVDLPAQVHRARDGSVCLAAACLQGDSRTRRILAILLLQWALQSSNIHEFPQDFKYYKRI
jgi:serine/threonine protein kinase